MIVLYTKNDYLKYLHYYLTYIFLFDLFKQVYIYIYTYRHICFQTNYLILFFIYSFNLVSSALLTASSEPKRGSWSPASSAHGSSCAERASSRSWTFRCRCLFWLVVWEYSKIIYTSFTLVGGFKHGFDFSIIVGMMIQSDFHIFYNIWDNPSQLTFIFSITYGNNHPN